MMPKGTKMLARQAKCSCGTMLLRATHWRNPRCDACRKKAAATAENKSLKVLRKQARRCRILMHLMGYEDDQFDELVKEIKGTYLCLRKKPETRAARYDLRLERRSAA